MKRIQSKNFPPLEKIVHHDVSVNFRIGSKQIVLDQENKEGVNFFFPTNDTNFFRCDH